MVGSEPNAAVLFLPSRSADSLAHRRDADAELARRLSAVTAFVEQLRHLPALRGAPAQQSAEQEQGRLGVLRVPRAGPSSIEGGVDVVAEADRQLPGQRMRGLDGTSRCLVDRASAGARRRRQWKLDGTDADADPPRSGFEEAFDDVHDGGGVVEQALDLVARGPFEGAHHAQGCLAQGFERRRDEIVLGAAADLVSSDNEHRNSVGLCEGTSLQLLP